MLLLILLSGCSSGARHQEALQQLGPIDWSRPLAVATTHAEPETHPAAIQVAWGPAAFAIAGAGESDLAERTLVVAGQAYTTQLGYGWVQQPRDDGLANGLLSNRLALWDLRGLLMDADLGLQVTGSAPHQVATGSGRLAAAGGIDVAFTIRLEDGKVAGATVSSSKGRESPFTFTPIAPSSSGAQFPFSLDVPSPTRSPQEVAAGDAASLASHRKVIGWLQAYGRARGGAMPDQVTADTLRLEVVASQGQWPDGAYDGQPLADRPAAGHFHWVKCGTGDALYTGYGWPGTLVVQAFGRGCAPP